MPFLKKQILDRVGGDYVHSWQPEEKSVDWEQAKKRKESKEGNWSRMEEDGATCISKPKE